MKKILYFSIAVLLIASCKDDDKKPALEGTWIPVVEVTGDCDDEADNGTIEYDDNGCSDGVCVEVTFQGGTMTIKETEGGDTDTKTYTYTTDGGYLYVSDGVNQQTVIFNETDKTLALTYEAADDGCVVVITYNKK